MPGSGLWNQHLNDYDDAIVNVLPVDRAQLARPKEMDQPSTSLLEPYRSQWPRLKGVKGSIDVEKWMKQSIMGCGDFKEDIVETRK